MDLEQQKGVIRLRSITLLQTGWERLWDLPAAPQPQCPGELWLQRWRKDGPWGCLVWQSRPLRVCPRSHVLWRAWVHTHLFLPRAHS